jgi:O-antigen ligase
MVLGAWSLVCVAMSESVAAAIALGVAVALAAISTLRRDAAVATLGGLVVTWLAVVTTTAFAFGAGEDLTDRRQALRVELWGRALQVVEDAPLRGRGPGSFAPQVAFWDADLRWAHHEYLQQAAEVGVVGLVLLLALVAWLFAYLWWGRARGLIRTVAGASAVTLVALHATVDHVVHTAVIPLTLAVLVGWATADPRRRGTPGSRPLRP